MGERGWQRSISRADIVRFWSKVDQTDECWLWTAATDTDGYGRFWIAGQNRGAHMVGWVLANGPLPVGLEVRHLCPGGADRACVRWSHLASGTSLSNRADAMREGTVPRGDRHHNAKLTAADVRIIRDRLAGGVTQSTLAEAYGVDQTTISHILHGKVWNHV